MLQTGVIKGLDQHQFLFGGNEADIIGVNAQSRLRIEVKGTTKGFEYFGEKDIKSDYLIWFDLANLLKGDGDGHLRLYIISHPSSYFDKPVKIVISKLARVARGSMASFDFEFSALTDQLARAQTSQTGGRRL